MTNTLSETARSLSKAQRAALVGMRVWRHGSWILREGGWSTHLALESRGLTECVTALTPLGEQVRTHILTEEQQP
jgi:hypothetical protein